MQSLMPPSMKGACELGSEPGLLNPLMPASHYKAYKSFGLVALTICRYCMWPSLDGCYSKGELLTLSRCPHRPQAPAFSLASLDHRGRSSFVQASTTPGPIYSPRAAGGSGASRGPSFGLRERTVDARSTTSVRYHGPLAADAFLGTAGPGPKYNVADVDVAAVTSRFQRPSAASFPMGRRFGSN